MSEWQPVGAEDLLASIEAAMSDESQRQDHERHASNLSTIALGREDPDLPPSFVEMQRALGQGANSPQKSSSHEAMGAGSGTFRLVRDWDPAEVAAGRGSYVPILPPGLFPTIPDAPPPPQMVSEPKKV